MTKFFHPQTSQSVNNGSQTTMVPSTVQVISNATANSNSLVLDKLDSSDAGQFYCVATLAGDKTIVIKSISVTIGKKISKVFFKYYVFNRYIADTCVINLAKIWSLLMMLNGFYHEKVPGSFMSNCFDVLHAQIAIIIQTIVYS